MGIVPKPLTAEQTASLVELIKNPPKGEENFILELLTDRIPPGVDEAAYVKAGFLAAIAKGETTSPILNAEKATELLGTMQGGYNVTPLIDLLDNASLAPIAVKALSHTLLVFDAFHDVQEKADGGNAFAQQVMQSWADAEWFTSKPKVAEKLTVTVFKVTVKPIPTIYRRRPTPGPVRTFPCTPKPCCKCQGKASPIPKSKLQN